MSRDDKCLIPVSDSSQSHKIPSKEGGNTLGGWGPTPIDRRLIILKVILQQRFTKLDNVHRSRSLKKDVLRESMFTSAAVAARSLDNRY